MLPPLEFDFSVWFSFLNPARCRILERSICYCLSQKNQQILLYFNDLIFSTANTRFLMNLWYTLFAVQDLKNSSISQLCFSSLSFCRQIIISHRLLKLLNMFQQNSLSRASSSLYNILYPLIWNSILLNNLSHLIIIARVAIIIAIIIIAIITITTIIIIIIITATTTTTATTIVN